ncbi:MAG: GNAT family N-acetyltransferase [Anaerolineae bacterium]|nr:GNAT family N-acetyltransferase [Anaerolineae bacterium]
MIMRDFTPDDYQAVVDIQNAIYPDHPAVVEDWTEMDENRDPKCKHHRWVALEDDKIVGMGQYDQDHWQYHPQKFIVMVRVTPEYQGHGTGKALYETVITALAPFDPIQLNAGIREDHSYAQQWLEKLGYALHVRDQRSALVPATFDPAPFAGLEDKLAAAGITIKSYVELAGDPDCDRKLYELDIVTVPDSPGNEDFTPPGLEAWTKDVIDAPMQPKEVYLVAVTDAGEYVGLTNLWIDRASDMLYTGLTAVKREYRRKGIATALKVRAILWAQARECSRINTDNAETNPMLQLNYRLGFRPLPAYVLYRNVLREEVGAESVQEQITS